MFSMVIQGARVAPVPVDWAAMPSADPSTQITVIAGLLTCVYRLVQIVLIVRHERIEYEKDEVDKREHRRAMASLAAGRIGEIES